VDAGVRAPGDRQLDVLAAQDGLQRRAELTGDRPPTGLLGPAGEGPAVVLEDQFRPAGLR
jgi:hypothetical protein